MNQADLGERMAELRPNWSRSTVVKLENFKRQEVSVGDLLALALALGVPPLMLLADPRHVDEVPLAIGSTHKPWSALLWMIGRLRIEPRGCDPAQVQATYQDATQVMTDGWNVLEYALELKDYERVSLDDNDDPDQVAAAEQRDAARHRAALRRMRITMRSILASGAELPPIPDYVYERARELGVDLPGTGG